MRPRLYTAEQIKQNRRLQQMKRRARDRILMSASEIENRQVNCPNEVIKERIKLASQLKARHGGLIPEEVFDEYFPPC